MTLTAYRNLIESLSEPTVLLSGSGAVVGGNSAALHLLGSFRDNETMLQDLIEPGGESIAVYLAAARGSDEPVIGQFTLRLADGEASFSTRCSVLESPRPGSEAILLLQIYSAPQALTRDFDDELARHKQTELERQLLERAEILEVANRRKNAFLAMLAHELRNPLAPIRNAVQLLKLNPSLVSEVTVILDRQTTHLNRLVNDLLDVSRITRGKIAVNRERLDFRALVRAECSDHLSRFEQSDVTLTIITPDEPVIVMADQTRMTQVLGNLLHNAQKFTPPGGHVEVELNSSASNAILTVSDTGKGLSASLMHELFEPFSQGDQSLDRTEGGLGLGLSLVKGIVELHGGHIDAHSAGEGAGSTFTVTLPVSRASVDDSEPVMQVSCFRKKILLIEDNPDQARSMSLLLELLGSDVDIATDGIEGLRKADEINPDVIICDIGLPKLDGFGVAQRLRESQQTESTLLIALTGYGQDDFIEKAREAGFDRHFLKPMSLQEIEQVIVPR